LKLSEKLEQKLGTYIKIYDKYKNDKTLTQNEIKEILPTRDDFIAVYRYLTKISENNKCILIKSLFSRQISSQSDRDKTLPRL
jgi:hypothetical protein